MAEPLRKPVFVKVKDLDPSTHGVNIVLKLDVALEGVKDECEVKMGDETGTLSFLARGEQCKLFANLKKDCTVIVRNGLIRMKSQTMRLEVNKWGKLDIPTEQASFKVDKSNDISAVEYELVPVAE